MSAREAVAMPRRVLVRDSTLRYHLITITLKLQHIWQKFLPETKRQNFDVPASTWMPLPATTIEYMCTKFGVDSSSRFPFIAQTNRQTKRQTDRRKWTNALPTPAAMPAWATTKVVYFVTDACLLLLCVRLSFLVLSQEIDVDECHGSRCYWLTWLNYSISHNNSLHCTWHSAVHTAAHSTWCRPRAGHVVWNSCCWLAADILDSRSIVHATVCPCTRISSFLP